MPGKRVNIDDESWMALDLLARDRMATFQELADEAFADLLKKHGRPVDLKAALRKSAGASAEVVNSRPARSHAGARSRRRVRFDSRGAKQGGVNSTHVGALSDG